MANMTDDLREARVLAGQLPSPDMIKLHKRQCESLRVKLIETLKLMEREKASYRHPVRYSKVFHELHLLVKGVKVFVEDCCYKREKDFVLAAIRVSAHRERFVKYQVELKWYIFLVIKCIKVYGRSVSSQTLEGFGTWKENVGSLPDETRRIVEEDYSDYQVLLKQHVEKPGEHQKICVTLLRRCGDNTVLDHVDHGVPPLERIIGHYIGTGGFGGVHEVNWKKTLFAVKMPCNTSETLDTEVKILEKCSHQNIVNLILFHKFKPDGKLPDEKKYLMMDRLSMDLSMYIKKKFPFAPSVEVDMILQIGEGMRYLGELEQQVSHRDLKPQNILVKEGPVLELQVSDFGLGRFRAELGVPSSNSPNVGTTRYRAPELTTEIRGESRKKLRAESLKADMFSFAVTCSCILTGKEPYEGRTQEEVRALVKEGRRPSLPAHCPPELSSLLDQCWHSDPSKRPASFAEICDKLRKLKAKLLVTCDHVDEGDDSSEASNQENYIQPVTFNSSNPPLRILVLGDPKAVDAAFRSLCGAAHGRTVVEAPVEGHVVMRESRSASPPMCLYKSCHGDKPFKGGNITDFKAIKTFVERRNKRWYQNEVMAAWRKDLRGWKTPGMTAELFPNSRRRLHMVWFVCTGTCNLPNSLQWDEITKLYGLPVQMLVTSGKLEYENIRQCNHGGRFFSENQMLEGDLLMEVDLTDAAAKESLWQTCWKVKTRTEIANSAMIISAIGKRLGPDGKLIHANIAATISEAFSVEKSNEFILNFLCTYWEIPQSFVKFLVCRIEAQQAASRFVLFSLQTATSILYSERKHPLGSDPAEANAPFRESEAQACSKSYFTDLVLASACDKMRFRDIEAFLRAVFEGKDVPYPLVREPDRNSSFSKTLKNALTSFGRSKRFMPW